VVADGTAGPVTEKQRALLDAAIKNVDRLTRLITDILDLSKLETRRMHYRIVEGSINDVLSHVAKSCEAVAAKKGIYIRTALDPFLPLVCLDRDRAAQVMYNLVSNAMKFTRAGGITISSAKDDSGAKVTVEDTGCGIMKDDMQRIFEKFEQVDRPEEGKPEGTGLGLAISKQIVEQLGGRIWAESEYGKGSKFMFTLPFKERLIRDETE
jgi:signal transduction histidine kinase